MIISVVVIFIGGILYLGYLAYLNEEREFNTKDLALSILVLSIASFASGVVFAYYKPINFILLYAYTISVLFWFAFFIVILRYILIVRKLKKEKEQLLELKEELELLLKAAEAKGVCPSSEKDTQ